MVASHDKDFLEKVVDKYLFPMVTETTKFV